MPLLVAPPGRDENSQLSARVSSVQASFAPSFARARARGLSCLFDSLDHHALPRARAASQPRPRRGGIGSHESVSHARERGHRARARAARPVPASAVARRCGPGGYMYTST